MGRFLPETTQAQKSHIYFLLRGISKNFRPTMVISDTDCKIRLHFEGKK
jgi:hypothetical protein